MKRPVDRRAVLTTALLGLILTACGRAAVEEVATTAAVPVTVAEAMVDTIARVVTATGTVVPAPEAEWTIVAPGPARIAALPVSAGESVKAGDLLVRFDIPSLAADLSAGRASVDQAGARLTAAEANLRRLTGLVERGIAAARDVEDARRTRDEAAADLSQARSSVTAATVLADRAVVRARFAGVVARRWHSVDDMVEPSIGDPVLRVIDPARLQVAVAVPVADLARIATGEDAAVHPPSGEDERARVITRPAEVDPASATAEVRLRFLTPTRLASGTVVEVDVIVETRPGAVVVPSASVIRDGGAVFVMVAGDDEKAHRHAVTLGLEAGGRVQILSGLEAGARVILRTPEALGALPDGAAITVTR